MIALFPIPGAIAGKIQKVQKETMKRVSIFPCQYLGVGVHFAVRRMRVYRPLPRVRSQTQVCVTRVLICLICSYGHIAHDQAVWLGAQDRRAAS